MKTKRSASAKRAPDWIVLFLTMLLLVLGWVVLYSASAVVADAKYGDQYFFLKKQLMWSGVGIVGMLFAIRMDLAFLQRNARKIFAVVLIMLVAVLVVGHSVGGSRRWLRIAGIGFQPSEFAKLGLILVLADYLDRKQSKLVDFWHGFLPPMILLALVTGLIALEPDLGTPMLIVLTGVGMIFLAGAQLRHMAILGLLAAPVLYYELFHVAYRRSRIFAFLDPWKNAQGVAYQLVQSFLAIGSGGFFGRGSGESTIKLHYLPEAQTDFIFSIIGEEFGLIGTTILCVLFFSLAWRCFWIATQASNWFETCLAAGVSFLLGGQALINLGVVTGLLPTKGIPLPFISFGGSSLVLTLVSVGLLLNVSCRMGGASVFKARRRR